jgi:Tol biopolymer transport system component
VRATKVNYTFTENIVPELPQTPSVNEDGSLIAFTLRSPSDAEFHPGRNICGVALERGTWSGIPCDFGFFRPVTPRRGSFLFLNSPLLLAMDYGSRLLVYNRGTDAFRTTPEQEPFMYVGVVLSPDKTSMLYRKSNGTLSAFNFATSAESDAQHLQSYWDTASDVLGDPQKVYSADFHFVAGYEKPTSVSAEPYILNTSTKEKTYPLQGTMYEGYSAIPLAVSSNGRYLFLEIPYTLQRTNPARVERRSFVVRMNLQTKEFIMLLNSDGSEDFASHGIGISDDGSTFAVLKQIGTSPLPTFAIGRFDGTTPPPAAPSSASARSSSSQDNFESICDINPSACQSSRSSSRMSSSAPSSRPPTPPGPIAANLCIALMRDPTISADGNTILFYGALRQVGDPDYMNWRETGFYIYDRQSTSLLTAVPRGNVINFMSAALAADGRSIAFIKGSDASWKDAVSGREIALAPQSVNPGISADGRFITYASYGSTTKGIWMYDRETQQRIQVYAALPNDDWMFYAPHRVSADGNIVAFMHGGSNQINIWNRSTGVTEQIAITVGNSNVELTSMDATGRYIAFVSNARNILNKDNMMDNSRPFTGVPDGFNAYVYDRETKKVQRYSIGVGGDQPGNDYMPVLSGDGRFLLYKSNRGTITQSLPNGTYRLFMQSVSSPYSATKIADVQPEATYRMDHDGSVVVFTGDYHLQVRENGIMTTLAPRKCE